MITPDEADRLVKAREAALAGCPISNVPVGELPRPEGTAAAPSLSAAEARSLPPIRRVELAHSLRAMAADFVFFTHAPLFVCGRFQADPVEEWMAVNDCPAAVFALEFHRPLFAGLRIDDARFGDHYNRLLMGCERPVWDKLYRHLNTLVAADPARRTYLSTFVNEGRMPDPKEWRPGADPAPVVMPFHAVGVSASFGLYYVNSFAGFLPPPYHRNLGPQKNPRAYLPALVRAAPEEPALKTAAALFGDKS